MLTEWVLRATSYPLDFCLAPTSLFSEPQDRACADAEVVLVVVGVVVDGG